MCDLPHGNIYVRLPTGYSELNEHELLELFKPFGEIDSFRLNKPVGVGQPHCLIRYTHPASAANAIHTLNGTYLDGQPIVVKLADADVVPKVQSGQIPSEWVYCRGLPHLYTKEDVISMFLPFLPILDMKIFPSTESYRGTGALLQLESLAKAAAAITALNGCIPPGGSQPMLARFADSPSEKAAKAARKERVGMKGAVTQPVAPVFGQSALADQLQRQIMDLTLCQVGQFGGDIPTSVLQSSLLRASGNSSSESVFSESGPIGWALQPGAIAPSNGHQGRGCSIYIKGMPEDADKLWMYEKFARFGAILSVRILIDEMTCKSNGIGFVNFATPEAARAAQETMNGISTGDKLLHVMVQQGPQPLNGKGAATPTRLSSNVHPTLVPQLSVGAVLPDGAMPHNYYAMLTL